MPYLVLVRHGASEWNIRGLWTGLTDIPLAPEGHDQAKKAGEDLKDIHFDVAFTGKLLRAQETLHGIMMAQGLPEIQIFVTAALNERDYGELTGKNKWEIKEKYGEEQFMKWRRSWDSPVPGGETLKDVYARVQPYYIDHILPFLKAGKNVLITASNNSLRALAKYLDNISDDDISNFEISTGEVNIYKMDDEGHVLGKEIKNVNEKKL